MSVPHSGIYTCEKSHFDELLQKRCNCSALAMELCLSCINPLIWEVFLPCSRVLVIFILFHLFIHFFSRVLVVILYVQCSFRWSILIESLTTFVKTGNYSKYVDIGFCLVLTANEKLQLKGLYFNHLTQTQICPNHKWYFVVWLTTWIPAWHKNDHFIKWTDHTSIDTVYISSGRSYRPLLDTKTIS